MSFVKSFLKKIVLKKKQPVVSSELDITSTSELTGRIIYIGANDPLPTANINIGDVVIPAFEYEVYNTNDINRVVRKYKTGVHDGIRWEVEEYTNNNRVYKRIE